MRNRWRLILPIVGLLLFSGVSLDSLHRRRAYQKDPGRYFYWASVRLDSDPLNQQPQVATPCKDAENGCVAWDPVSLWVDPGFLAKMLLVSAIPAFVIGIWFVRILGHHGVNEVLTFMAVMPVLVAVWYYAVGSLIDRWMYKRRQSG
jgi:hypothetical protein